MTTARSAICECGERQAVHRWLNGPYERRGCNCPKFTYCRKQEADDDRRLAGGSDGARAGVRGAVGAGAMGAVEGCLDCGIAVVWPLLRCLKCASRNVQAVREG